MLTKTSLLALLLLALAITGEAITIVITHATATVGITSASALAAVASGAKARVHIYLENDSDTTIYCKFGAAAVLNEGLRFAAAGTTGNRLVFTPVTGVPQVVLNCISSAGSKTLLIATGVQN